MTNTYFSTLKTDSNKLIKLLYTFNLEKYELDFWDEIWGVVKYIKIPYDTVMNMPIQDRKIIIQKHNMDIDRENGKNTTGNGGNITGEMLNSFAGLEQSKENV